MAAPAISAPIPDPGRAAGRRSPAPSAGRHRPRPTPLAATLLAAALLLLALGAALTGLPAGERSHAIASARPGAPREPGLSSLPQAAQGPVSEAIGADSPAYRMTASNGGFTAASPGQRLRLRFDSSGVSVRSGATQVALSLRAVGRGDALTALPLVAPRAKANRVTYAFADLSEWYANGPLGLEQGFTVRAAPAGVPSAPLTLSMALSGEGHAAVRPGGHVLVLGGGRGPSLRYGALAAVDASGRALQSRLALESGRLLIEVDTRGARYPVRIDPFIQQGEALHASGVTGTIGGVGWSVALSADGSTALVGGIADDDYVGAAWVFTRSGETWTQQGAKLTGAGESGAGDFGSSVALSADGNTALIGALADDDYVGAAWVFTRSGETWTQQAGKLTGGGEQGEALFGSSVALSSDGDTALVGGPSDDESCEHCSGGGAAWVFTRTGEAWTQQGGKLTAGGEHGASSFGSSVALSSDASTALIGAPHAGGGVGMAWVFTRSGGSWLTPGVELAGYGESGYGYFGAAVALSGDGETALVGAPNDRLACERCTGVGAAWVFTRSGEAWAQQGEKLTPVAEREPAAFGSSVALSSDGGSALIGGWTGDAAWEFARAGSSWTQQGERITAAEGVGETEFGRSVSLSADAGTALVGGPGEVFDSEDDSTGAAWAFAKLDSPAVLTEPATSVTRSAATLNAMVNPDGEEVSDCHFEYGLSEAYEASIPCSSLPGSGEASVPVSATVSGLQEGTTYHFRILATNPLGTGYGSSYGIGSFTTAPAGPEFGRCATAPSEEVGTKTVYRGDFSASTCLVRTAPRTGRYEWEPVLARHFTTAIKVPTKATLETVEGTKVTCTGETSTGEYTGTKTVGGIVVTLTGCELVKAKARCSSAGAAAGEVVAGPLEGTLGVITPGATPAKDKLGLDLYAAEQRALVAQFACGATTVAVEGSLIVPLVSNRMLLTSTLKASASKGKQKPEYLNGEPRSILEQSAGGAFAQQAGLALTSTETGEEEVEANSVF